MQRRCCKYIANSFPKALEDATKTRPQRPLSNRKNGSLSLSWWNFLAPKKHKGPKQSRMDTSWWLNHAGKGKSKKHLKPPPRINLKDDFCIIISILERIRSSAFGGVDDRQPMTAFAVQFSVGGSHQGANRNLVARSKKMTSKNIYFFFGAQITASKVVSTWTRK